MGQKFDFSVVKWPVRFIVTSKWVAIADRSLGLKEYYSIRKIGLRM